MDRIKGIPLAVVAAFLSPIFVSCAFFQQMLPGLTMSDANIVSILDSIDEGEIDAARLAQAKASDPGVRAFAGRLLNEHRVLGEDHERLAAQLSLQPDPPALGSHLKETHEKAMGELRVVSGTAFDRAYVRHEIQQHVQVFNFLETAAESESDPALKQQLVRTGPDLLSHISAARALERHLGSDQRDAVASR